MIEQVQIRGLHYLGGASDGLPQRTAQVSLQVIGDVQAWRDRAEAPDAVTRSLGLVLPVQALDPDCATQLLAQVRPPALPEQALANAAMRLCLAIQREARDPVWAGRVVQTRRHETGLQLRLALPYERESVLKDALLWAIRWWVLWGGSATSQDSQTVLLRQYQSWLEEAQRGGLPPNTLRFALAAYERGWPVSVQYQVLHIGWGAARKSLDSSFTGQTSQIAARIARDKYLTSRLLHQAGLPIPPSARVRDLDGGRTVAQRFGWPVVVKPANLDQGTGVVPDIRDDVTFREAFDRAAKYSPGAVIVEKHIAGDDHRLLVVNGGLLMATRRLPGGVTGDGGQTVAQLVERANTDPRRGTSRRSLMMCLVLDDEALACLKEQALSAESVPSPGQFVRLRRTANISTGGTAQDVSHLIHPDNRLLAERAARIVGLDIAGVDFLCPDITRSWREVGGGICEVNAQPGFRPHWLGDRRRDINGEILDLLFGGCSPRIPTAAVTGAKGKTAVAQMLHQIWQQAGHCTGLSCTSGVRLGAMWVHGESTPSVQKACQMLLPDSALQSLVLEISAQELLRDGHPLDRYDVVALLNLPNDPRSGSGIQSLDEMARLNAHVLQRATQALVVNADDTRCLQMGQQAGLPRRILVSASGDNNPTVLAHRMAGGHAVFPYANSGLDWVCLAAGQSAEPLMPMGDLAATDHDGSPLMAQSALFAIALAWVQGIPLVHIRTAMSQWQCSAGG